MATFKIGDTVRVTADFYQVPDSGSNVLADPTALTCTLKIPLTGEVVLTYGTSPELTKLSVGKYKVEYVMTQPGQWHARWKGTGAVAAVQETYWSVDSTPFANP